MRTRQEPHFVTVTRGLRTVSDIPANPKHLWCLAHRPFAWGPGFPAPMNPQPLVRIAANGRLQPCMDGLSIPLNISRHLDLGLEVQHVALLCPGPYGVARHDRRAAMVRQFYERAPSAGRHSEEI